jgi:hypothetical protein
MERAEIENLLDAGKLQICMINGTPRAPRWYDVRRNGKTQTWKRQPERFSIPVRVGFRDAFRIEDTKYNFRERPADFNPRTQV